MVTFTGRRQGWRGGGAGLRVALPVLCWLWATGVGAQNGGPGPVNIAAGHQESSYSMSTKYKSSGPASNGANGNKGGTYSADNCIHTDHYYFISGSYRQDRNPWWQVDLGKAYSIYNIKIWGRGDEISRLYPFRITVDNTECVTVRQNPGTREITMNCTKPLYGQVVRLRRLDTGNWDYVLNMCEFEIFVCNPGYYGVNCDLPCGSFCYLDGCRMNDGECFRCEDGFWGSQCDENCGQCEDGSCAMDSGICTGCSPDWYGAQCLTRCPSVNCRDQRCDQGTGVCLGCEANFKGHNCTDCVDGMYGDSCQHPCSKQNPGCRLCERDGQCTACSDNFKAPNCTVCKDGYYKASQGSCQQCSSNCRSRSCDPETGKCNGCSDGRHGGQCRESCEAGCEACDQDTGQCTRCRYNRAPPDCSECLDGYYRPRSSSRQCYECTWNCLNGTVCDKLGGRCPVCPPGKKGDRCSYSCSRGTYGQNCSQQCGRCLNDRACNVEDGACTQCQSGWQPPLCQKECEDGTYGAACKHTCGQCAGGAACDKAQGHCRQCEPGWVSNKCETPCVDGLYGVDCRNRCATCLGDAVCNKTNGHCPACPVGKQPPLCDKECQNQTYGKDCQEKCGQCRDGLSCDPSSGHCPRGCQPGWMDASGSSVHLCRTACPAGFYGDQCNETCGHCDSSGPCYHVTGRCLQGCAKGFIGDLCTEEEPDEGLGLMTIVGIVIAVIVIIIIVIVVLFVILKKKKKARKAKGYRDVPGELSHSRDGMIDPQDPSILSTTSLTVALPDQVADRRTDKPHAQVKPMVKTESTKTNGAIYENVAIPDQDRSVPTPSAGAGQRDKVKASPKPEATGKAGPMNRQAGKAGNWTSGKETPPEALTDDEADFEFDEEVYGYERKCREEQPTSIRLDALLEAVLEKLERGQLDEEFLRIVPKKDYPITNGQREENYYKNRFNSILPYDKNRVVLEQVDGDDASDYVNASFVKGPKTAKDYIAAQGPKHNTVDDWWRMVWQEGVTDIVMLTNTMEGIKHKCYQYWPASGAVLNTGHMVVTGGSEDHRAHFVIREFVVRQAEGQERRVVRQYHYLSWKDHEVPATTALVSFWRHVTSRAVRSLSAPPLVVHCSAGVGRTGTFIALDIVLAHARREAEVDVYNVVSSLRDDRCHMVQNKNQYAFLYEAVLEAFLSENTRMQNEDLDLAFPRTIRHDVPSQRIDTEFQKLCQLRNTLTTPSFTIASQPENQAKNRSPHVLPDDKHLVFLTQHVKGRNQYINAVYMPTFIHARGSITTQLPLPDTLVDIWRLIDGCDVNTVVSLGNVEEQGDLCCYWPSLGGCLKTGIYTISVQSVAQIGDYLDSYILTMQKEKANADSREIRLLHFKGWRGLATEDTGDLIQLLDVLCSASQSSAKPVVVQCIDGAAHSGLLCALWDVVSRMRSDGEVDVYMAARQVTTVTPQAFSAVEEYRYCYQVVQCYKSSQSIYANT